MTASPPPAFRAGLIGKGIQASLTPAMHMMEGRAQGLDYRYELLDLDRMDAGSACLADLIAQVEAEGFGGLNVTHPCKQAAVELVDTLSAEAAALGAINTIVLRNGRRHGHNTDWWGFAESFRRGLPQADLRSVVQLGAGGAGAATAFAILHSGAERLALFDSDETRAANLTDTMRRYFPSAEVEVVRDLEMAMAAASGLVHATPTGMEKYPGLPLPADLLRPSLWVAEIVYFPLNTELLMEARRRGCRVLDGGGMAVFQAVKAFELFTGLEPDAERMRRHFIELTQPARSSALAAGSVR
ncbi:shikimate dehydrogenase [Pseudorhizobium endolithicum]|uniref:Shikimate dehydrogenase n=1 Tax=Pseudorhizobium endolithicum TaxID=1191678 RepID=A0ABM8PUA0_9HYPH|nr:shikimate dehydrogenase [Pseudorhizobium endolithicum]CAD6430029.1 shikimate dehydrogenase [Rhizobium sp. Q54]CAD7048867.1 shikimate dehydrogenase [Pseudorhizobium endolithicum]